MPIRFVIDHEKQIIYETWDGEISYKDLEDFWNTISQNPDVMSIRRSLVDARKAIPIFSGAELSNLIHEVAPLLIDLGWITAIVVERPVQLGISNQYRVFAESYSQDAIFQDPDLALQWLVQQKHKSSSNLKSCDQ
ncbi:MAG: hypothetical protein ABSA86_09985 [Oryzomonas sp.]|jgi:hypothetical protein